MAVAPVMSAPAAASAWAPLRNRVFAVLWGATLVGNIGAWMRDVGSGWLMTELAPSPLMVAWSRPPRPFRCSSSPSPPAPSPTCSTGAG